MTTYIPLRAQPGLDLFRLGSFVRRAWWIVAALSLWLRSGFAIHAIGDAGMDDALFVRLARSLGAGLWLGAFDNTTLVKGMFYPLFILLSFAAGIPLKLAEQGVYLAASAYVALLVARSERRRWAGTALFVALAFNPILWTVSLSRIIREGLYIGLSLALVGLVMAVVVSRHPMTVAGLSRGLVLGLLGGAFWLTREEGVWLVPAIALILLLGLTAAPRLAARWAPLGMAVLGLVVVIGADMVTNKVFYGVVQTVEVKSPAFEHAYGALSRIEHQKWRRYIVFPKEARELAYQVSPAARELRPSLDGDNGEAWRAVGCIAAPMPECTEIQSSWFQWALRDAVRQAGHYSSLREAARFYRRLAQEIDDACDRGAIPCLPPRSSLTPPFRWHFIADAVPAALNLATMLIRPDVNEIQRRPSEGPAVAIDLFAETAGPVVRSTQTWFIMDGWMGAQSGTPLLTLRAPPDVPVRSEILVKPGELPSAAQPFPLVQVRFVTDCPPQSCDLVIEANGRTVDLGKIDAAAVVAPVKQPDLFFTATRIATHISAQGQNRRNAMIERIARGIGQGYAVLLPILTVLGAVGLAATLATRRLHAFASPIVILAAASAVAVVSRVALLAYVDVTSILSQNTLYASPASPFVIVFAVLGTIMLAEAGMRSIGR